MPILCSQIRIPITMEPETAIEKAYVLAGIKPGQAESAFISKISVDARHKHNICFVCSVLLQLKDKKQEQVLAKRFSNIQLRNEAIKELAFRPGEQRLASRPVVAGFGPCGIFAALVLAQHGYRPIVLERGGDMDSRIRQTSLFWEKGLLDESTNVQFGEGGAGTFSDGKLTTRINDPLCEYILQEFVRFGAPEDILYKAKPHIGTDRLRQVVKNIRQEIIRLGGEVLFHTCLKDVAFEGDSLYKINTSAGEIPCSQLILATGHSARDTFSMLQKRGLPLQAKPFSVGVRIEHKQQAIDHALFGSAAGSHPLLKGEYQLSWRQGGRGVYTFCMCPGGIVVPSSSEPEQVVTNGMSYYSRAGENANSALVVSVTPDDFGHNPLDGVKFQQALEHAAFIKAGSNYTAPCQSVGNFLKHTTSTALGNITPSYAVGVSVCDLHTLFPPFINQMLENGLACFNKKISGFACNDAVLTGVESRTSSPIRILRQENGQSVGMAGIYPAGEGAGYAGGIMSAACDGIKAARHIIEKFSFIYDGSRY